MAPFDVRQYWEERYACGGDSGYGSRGHLARFKASFLNDFVAGNGVRSVIELGCGDGQQLCLARYPRYVGLDVSPSTVGLCASRFGHDPTKIFRVYHPRDFEPGAAMPHAELGLSLDVVYHLVDEGDFHCHLTHLFAASDRFVIIYSTDSDQVSSGQGPHLKHRLFSGWVADQIPGWTLSQRVVNPYQPDPGERTVGYPDFFVYARQ